MSIISSEKLSYILISQMLRGNFFLKFFNYRKNRSQEIVKLNTEKKSSLEDLINLKIIDIDQKISENNKALVEAQIVKLRSTVSRQNNLIEQIGKNIYKTRLEDSINWHQEELKQLYVRRRELEINLEKVKGIFWLNQIKRTLRIVLQVFFIFLSLFIFLSGFMIIIYLLPLMILIFIAYFILTKR